MLEREILKLPGLKHFKNEEEVYSYIETIPTIEKIFIAQNLLKEMLSIKGLFEENKNRMKEKIDLNCYQYFKNTLLIKEICDYCVSGKPETTINYILLKKVNELLFSFEEEYNNKDFIEKFFFALRNDNSLTILYKKNSKFYINIFVNLYKTN